MSVSFRCQMSVTYQCALYLCPRHNQCTNHESAAAMHKIYLAQEINVFMYSGFLVSQAMVAFTRSSYKVLIGNIDGVIVT